MSSLCYVQTFFSRFLEHSKELYTRSCPPLPGGQDSALDMCPLLRTNETKRRSAGINSDCSLVVSCSRRAYLQVAGKPSPSKQYVRPCNITRHNLTQPHRMLSKPSHGVISFIPPGEWASQHGSSHNLSVYLEWASQRSNGSISPKMRSTGQHSLRRQTLQRFACNSPFSSNLTSKPSNSPFSLHSSNSFIKAGAPPP